MDRGSRALGLEGKPSMQVPMSRPDIGEQEIELVNQVLRTPYLSIGPMIERLERGSENLELLLAQVYAFSQALNSQEGTVGRLIRDPQLYENLNKAVANIEQVSRDLKPVVRDVRVFSDKIARHPELLGVRGALEQTTGTKGAPRLSELLGTSGRANPASYSSEARPR